MMENPTTEHHLEHLEDKSGRDAKCKTEQSQTESRKYLANIEKYVGIIRLKLKRGRQRKNGSYHMYESGRIFNRKIININTEKEVV